MSPQPQTSITNTAKSALKSTKLTKCFSPQSKDFDPQKYTINHCIPTAQSTVYVSGLPNSADCLEDQRVKYSIRRHLNILQEVCV